MKTNEQNLTTPPVDLEKLAEDLAAWVVKPAELKAQEADCDCEDCVIREIQKTLRTATSGMAAQLTAANAEIERLKAALAAKGTK